MDPNTLQLWLWLSQQDPRTLDPQTRAQFQALHDLFNRQMRDAPAGMFAFPTQPSTLQLMHAYYAQRPLPPYIDRFVPMDVPRLQYGPTRSGGLLPKTGVEPLSPIEPIPSAESVQWRL